MNMRVYDLRHVGIGGQQATTQSGATGGAERYGGVTASVCVSVWGCDCVCVCVCVGVSRRNLGELELSYLLATDGKVLRLLVYRSQRWSERLQYPNSTLHLRLNSSSSRGGSSSGSKTMHVMNAATVR